MTAGRRVSERVRLFMERVGSAAPSHADPAGALELVAGQGLAVFPALRDFESEFGGLSFSWRTRSVVLGIAAMHALVGDLHAGPDGSRVLVGRADAWTEISMSRDGALWAHGPDDFPWELAASAVGYLEQLALIAWIADWCGDPFRVLVEPLGSALAETLGLSRDAAASDDHGAAWTDGACWLLQRLKGDPYHTSFAEMLCRDIDAAADALLRLRQWRPSLRIQVAGAEIGVTEEVSRHGYAGLAQVPSPDAWAREPNATAFAYLGDCFSYLGGPADTGVVWLFGERGERRFEQYVRPGSDPDAGFLEWSSHGAGGAVRRRYIPVYPAS